jgi:hypothetical protein
MRGISQCPDALGPCRVSGKASSCRASPRRESAGSRVMCRVAETCGRERRGQQVDVSGRNPPAWVALTALETVRR